MTALRVETFADVAALGPEWDGLFGQEVQSGRAWFGANAEAALPEGAAAAMVGVLGPEGPVGLLPMVAGPGNRRASLTTPYTCVFQPLVRAGRAREMAAAIGRACRRWDVILLEALDSGWPDLPAFRAGLREAGWRTRLFEHFGNWHEAVPDGNWGAYLASRPGTLRETIRRKGRLVEQEPGMRLEFVDDSARLGTALDAYESVYARSWKRPEPFPRFNQALVSALGPPGILRFAVLWAGSTPVAAQYWTVLAGVATVLKLAHDDAFRRFSPGTVLTAFAIRSLIERDGVTHLDFGRGDDPYKRSWAAERRVRVGLLVADPRSRRGALALLRHDGGRLLRLLRAGRFSRQRFSLE